MRYTFFVRLGIGSVMGLLGLVGLAFLLGLSMSLLLGVGRAVCMYSATKGELDGRRGYLALVLGSVRVLARFGLAWIEAPFVLDPLALMLVFHVVLVVGVLWKHVRGLKHKG